MSRSLHPNGPSKVDAEGQDPATGTDFVSHRMVGSPVLILQSNQIRLEIKHAMLSMPGMAVLTALCFVVEVRGYTKLYDSPEEGPFALYTYLQYPRFIAFTDCGIYFIHRGLHHPWVYKHLHKAHHKWIVSTPFASYAFHPVDGFSQSFPYHLYPFLFPLQKIAYLALFVFVTIWTVMIREP
ncbi:sterol desaturase family protein [Aspergillus melleus]|uniref:sterol desaturase family protein n=1 Tax=Aspergillus melleus TaxID=138277 RepID=UPI001E8D18A8|nr:c-5 sterol desaturase [Aspergillus melleus]KAH8434246.1 c-5 sterol desaturase [Aspergillus melleus]